MFSLYKQRNFSALINDTFGFFRAYGKSYFKYYFIINGGLLLILLLLMYFVGGTFMETVFSNIGDPQNGDRIIEEYFNSNVSLFITAGIIGGIIMLILSLLNYSYPVIFMKLVENNTVPDTKQVLNAIGRKLGRIILFSLLWLITFLPIIIIVGALSLVLIVIIIGIPFVLILFAAISSWMYLSFFDYLNNNSSYFDALKNGWNILFQNFWHHVGSTAIFYVIITVIHSIVSFIPYFMGIFSILNDSMEGRQPSAEAFSFFGLLMTITFMLSTLLAYVLGNFMFVNQGIIYYSAREENENLSRHSEIDLIGRDSE
jgi:hypothetical protein